MVENNSVVKYRFIDINYLKIARYCCLFRDENILISKK